MAQFQGLVANVANGKGSLGKLLVDDQLYKSANDTVDKLNHIIDDLRAGKGSAGKFLSDSALYDNANKTMASVKQMTDDINAGKGAIGRHGPRPGIRGKAEKDHGQRCSAQPGA